MPKISIHLISNKIIQNLFAWLLVFLLLIATVKPDNKVGTAIFAICLLAPAVYISNFLVLPLLKRKRAFFFRLFVSNALIFTVVSALITTVVSDHVVDTKMLITYFGIMMFALIMAAALKIARDNFSGMQEVELKSSETRNVIEDTVDSIFVKSDKKIIKVMLDEIQYVEAYGNYIKIFTEEMILTPRTLTDFLEKLPNEFIQVHKSFVLNFNHLKLIDGNQIVLQSGTKLPIGKIYKNAILDRIQSPRPTFSQNFDGGSTKHIE